MISSRQAAVLAASLLSAILLVPPASFADDRPANAGDSASDNDHNRKRMRGNDGGEQRGGERQRGERFGGDRQGTREANPQRGDQPNMKQPPAAGFGRAAPAARDQGFGNNAQPNKAPFGNNKPAFTQQPQRPPVVKPPVADTGSKTQTPPNTFSRDNVPNKFKQGDRDRPGQGFDQRQFGNQGNAPRPGNAAPTKAMPDFGAASPDRARLPRPPSAAEAKKRFENLRKARTEKVEAGGNVVIREPGNRTIIKQNNRIVIQHDETERLRRVAPNARFEKGKGGMNIAVVDRPGNVKIYSETDASGHLIRRYRRGPDGRDVIIIDNRRGRHGHGGSVGRDIAAGVGIGIGVVAGAALLNSVLDVPPPRVRIPRDRYIVDYEGASEDDVYDALSAPPVDEYSDRYTLDEVRATATLRDRMRRVDLDDINFEFGSWEVDPSEYRKLERVARAMQRVISRNPDEVFMIEGYTDAVGSPEDNLSLSDRRAESVAEVLTEEFNVPFENLVTQGYGEDYLKVQTPAPERANRRVAVRRITPLLARGDGPPDRR